MKRKIDSANYLSKGTKVSIVLCLLFFQLSFGLSAGSNVPLRRPISPSSPMWLVHIDTWNWPDPQKIIDLIPKDIRPYVVMNISLSISHNDSTGAFNIAEYGYETAKSWLRTCAQNKMWAVIQPSSGGFSHFSDFDLSVYEEFFRDYPNFLGFNYAEQFWGFDDKFSVTFPQRLAHWVDLMKLNQKYGGYLISSFCGSYYAASLNPIAMMKRDANFAAICKQDPEHFIECEKFTSSSCFSDIESTCEGAYLSGYSGQYGIRFDQCGWVGHDSTDTTFPVAAGAAPVIEHVMLTGETVIDGPELIWQQCTKEISTTQTSDGYTMRRWEYYPQYKNITLDIFRKILDGTIRILNRQEVIDRTKLVIVNDVSSGSDQDKYSSPQTLFEGLYRMDGDGDYLSNTTWFKKTGRYPTIPTVYQLSDMVANSFQVKVNKSAYSTRWPSTTSKVNEFNNLFTQEYTGDLYAGRSENGWVTYNPYKTGQTAKATIPFKYNTCDSLHLTYSRYTTGIIKEFSDKLTFYLTNYDNYYTSLKTDTIAIYGSTSKPTYSYQDRASHQTSTVTNSWSDGVFTLFVTHNGSLDITVNCSGSATGRLTSFKTATVTAPDEPAVYTGPRQYEAEDFDYKNISRNYTNGVNSGIKNYTGQGFISFGTNTSASIRDTINALRAGTYMLTTKYAAPAGIVRVFLDVNGVRRTVSFAKTAADTSWAVNTQSVSLNEGINVIQYTGAGSGSNILFDNVIIDRDDNGIYDFSDDTVSTKASTPPAKYLTLQSGSAGVVSYTDANNLTSNCFKTYSAGSSNGTGIADLDMFLTSASNYSVGWKEYYSTPGGHKGVLLRGSGNNGSCPYAVGMKQGYLFIAQNNEDSTITLKPYIADLNGITNKTAYTTTFKVAPNQPCWFRATAFGSQLSFECSADSVTWEGGSATMFIDSTYLSGSTELVWGLGSDNFSWVMDNIAQMAGDLSVSRFAMDGFSYSAGSGISSSKTFSVSGKSLIDKIVVQAPDNYEVSLSSDSGFASSLDLIPTSGTVPSTTIYVRLKLGLAINSYSGQLSVSSNRTLGSTMLLSGTVQPQVVSKIYDFSGDVATTSASTPPALNATIGHSSSATAGVVSYTDTKGILSNMLRPYSSGQRNATGVVDLNLFSKMSTDYSVVWKQCVGSSSTDYKVGVLLRGDTSKIGDASTGYVQGLQQGYLFIVYTAGGSSHSEFRIYKSTSSTSLSMLTNASISTLVPTAGQPVWYRATVSGSSTIAMKLEYSTDSITWNTGSSTTDTSSPMFTSGATQIVWGLGVGNVDFYLDNITFNGIESSTGTTTGIISYRTDSPTIVSSEYYTISGLRVLNNGNLKGLYIIRNRMSDGHFTSLKVIFK